MKNLLVTGHTGFLGSHLVNALQSKYNIIGVSTKRRKNLHFTQIKKDIRKITPDDIKFKIDCIIHLAAIISPKYCETNPTECLETNVIGTQKILEIARKKKSQFIYLSTSHVYGIPQKLPIKEEFSTMPISIYSASKLCGEKICQTYGKKYKIDFSIIRLFSIYGPGEPENFVIPKIFSQIKSKKIITLENLNSKRDFVYVDDVVNAIKIIIRKSKGNHIYNIGTGKSYSILNVCQILKKISGKNFQTNSIKQSSLIEEPRNIRADITKLKKLGWKPKISLNLGLSKFFEEYNQIHQTS